MTQLKYALWLAGAVLAIAVRPALAGDIPVYHSDEVKPYQAKDVKPYKARDVEIYRPGVDRAPEQGPLDPHLLGTWALSIPAAAWTTSTYEGNYRVDTTRVGRGGSLGSITVRPDGSYTWISSGRQPAKGRLVQVIPRSDAKPGRTYWLASNGQYEFCLTWEPEGEGRFLLLSPKTHHYAGEGKRSR